MAKANAILQPSTKRAAQKFNDDAARYEKSVNVSAKSARAALVKLGIHTKGGRLTARYKSK